MSRASRIASAVAGVFVALLSCARAGTRNASDQTTSVFRAPGAAATHYTAIGRGASAVVGERPSAALSAAVESTARMQQTTLAGDGRLATLASFCAKALAGGARAIAPEVVELVAQHLGIYDASPELVVVDAPRVDASGALARALAARLSERAFTHYGAALVVRERSSLVVIALSVRGLELRPTPRRVAVSELIRLQGRLPSAFENPRVEVTASGSVRRVLAVGAGPDFDVQLPADRPGVCRVEILGDTERGSVVLARFSIYVGTEPAQTFELGRGGPSFDLASLQRELLGLINAERARAGWRAVQADPALDRLARSHSADMRDHGFMSHESPRSGGPADRAERAGFGRGLVLENIVQGTDAGLLHASVLAQVGPRSNLLHPEVTHVGLGLVVLRQAQARTLLLTELLVQQSSATDPSLAAPELLSMLNRTRATRKAQPVALDPELAEVANEAARAFVDTPGAKEQSVIDAANAKLQRFSVAYRRVAVVLVLARALEDASTLEPALDAGVGNIGIGVAQGSRPDRGGPVLVIALVLAWPR